jgi:hypothetical protein
MRVRVVALASLASLLLSAPLAATATASRVGYVRDASSVASPGCSKLAPAPLTSTKPYGRGLFVPQGASSLLLCRYYGLNAQLPRHLQRERLVTSAAPIAQLTAEVNALPPLPQGIHCPFDDGREIVTTFRYPRRGEAVVSVGLTGCRVVSNASFAARTATGQAGSRLLAQLTVLVP